MLVNRTPNIITKILFNKLKERKITITQEQFSLLVILWQNDGCSQQFLADATLRDKPGITRLIHNLEKARLITREVDELDKRSNLVFLTNKAILLEGQVTNVVKEVAKEALSGIDVEKAKIYKEVVLKIHDNLIKAV